MPVLPVDQLALMASPVAVRAVARPLSQSTTTRAPIVSLTSPVVGQPVDLPVPSDSA